MGFCDAALGEDKVLVIHYLWHGRPHAATLSDRVRLQISSHPRMHSMPGQDLACPQGFDDVTSILLPCRGAVVFPGMETSSRQKTTWQSISVG